MGYTYHPGLTDERAARDGVLLEDKFAPGVAGQTRDRAPGQQRRGHEIDGRVMIRRASGVENEGRDGSPSGIGPKILLASFSPARIDACVVKQAKFGTARKAVPTTRRK